jgi:hypothetical protein
LVFTGMLALAAGCDGTRTAKPRARSVVNYQQQFVAEMEARQDFIADAEQRIDAIEDRISGIQSRIRPEVSGLSATEEAEWRQQLADLEREKETTRSRLEQARTADANEWRVRPGRAPRIQRGDARDARRYAHLRKRGHPRRGTATRGGSRHGYGSLRRTTARAPRAMRRRAPVRRGPPD